MAIWLANLDADTYTSALVWKDCWRGHPAASVSSLQAVWEAARWIRLIQKPKQPHGGQISVSIEISFPQPLHWFNYFCFFLKWGVYHSDESVNNSFHVERTTNGNLSRFQLILKPTFMSWKKNLREHWVVTVGDKVMRTITQLHFPHRFILPVQGSGHHCPWIMSMCPE